jgi:hypothetical protein
MKGQLAALRAHPLLPGIWRGWPRYLRGELPIVSAGPGKLGPG